VSLNDTIIIIHDSLTHTPTTTTTTRLKAFTSDQQWYTVIQTTAIRTASKCNKFLFHQIKRQNCCIIRISGYQRCTKVVNSKRFSRHSMILIIT